MLRQVNMEPPIQALAQLGIALEQGFTPPPDSDSVEATRQRLLHCMYLAHVKPSEAPAEAPAKTLNSHFKGRSAEALNSGRGGRRNREIFLLAVLAADAAVARVMAKAGVACTLCKLLEKGINHAAVSVSPAINGSAQPAVRRSWR